MLNKREQLAADSRRIEERAVEMRGVRQEIIAGQDRLITELRSELHDQTSVWPMSPADVLIRDLHRRVAASTGSRRERLSEILMKAQMVVIKYFRGRLNRSPARSATSSQKRAAARAWMQHFAS